MSNFLEDIRKVLSDEPVEAAVIGNHGDSWWREDGERDGSLDPDDRRFIAPGKRGIVLDWAEAAPLLDYEYDDGFGGADCHPVWIWTPTRVLFVSTYDGSTNVTSVPRNPAAGQPHMPGGG